MSNIAYFKPTKIADVIGDLEQYKFNPSSIKTVILNRLSDMLDGQLDIVDPSNPFIYLLETSCLNASFAIQEYTKLTKKLYPRMANNENDLYLHMSDYDYIGRFSEPAEANLSINILYSDFKKNAIFSASENKYIIKIPRMYTVSVDKFKFTILYPIIVSQHVNGVFDVRYDVTVPNELQPLMTNYIDFEVLNQYNTEKWLRFTIPVKELEVIPVEIPTERSKLFTQIMSIPSGKKFYYAEVHHLKNGVWSKMITTHTEEIYDISTPTACIKVLQETNEVEVYIPPVYTLNNLIGTKVRIDVYVTNGSIDVNFADYKTSDFVNEYTPVDKLRDLDTYTSTLGLIGKLLIISYRVIGGKDSLSFDDLKNSVIDNTIGDRKLPITGNQLNFEIAQQGFTLIKDVDITTNRIFHLQKQVPTPLTKYPVSKLDLDISEFGTTVTQLLESGIVKNLGTDRYIIPQGTLFVTENSVLRLLDTTESLNVKSLSGTTLLTEVNSKKYMSTFYHNVLDTNDQEVNLRVYDLDSAKVTAINFNSFNSTAQFGVNTKTIVLNKIDTGYTLDLVTNIKIYRTTSSVTDITPYLVYKDSEGTKFFLSGNIVSTSIDGVTLYRFYISTDYDIKSDDTMLVNSFKDRNGNLATINLNLDTELQIIYILNQRLDTYIPTINDDILVSTYLYGINSVVTTETVNIQLGYNLKYINRRVRNIIDVSAYQVYEEDIPLVYEHDVYGADGVLDDTYFIDDNGDLIDTIIHHRGEIVLDDTGEIVYKYRRGDVILDDTSNPIPVSSKELGRNLTLTFVDYRATLCTQQVYKDYYKYVKEVMTDSCINKLVDIQNLLLENTEAYLVIPNTINNTKVSINGTVDSYIDPAVKFNVTIYVKSKVYNDYDIRNNINYTIIKSIDDYLDKSILIKTELLNLLYTELKEFIESVTIDKLVVTDADYIRIVNSNDKLALKKSLTVDSSGYYNLVEDIAVNFVSID